ncbi:MAG: carboxypeptidase regulatory-like domain-containing protein [Planctomyces sp.]|nr:carboxypeptidase regulatory-like domain-containing protein [Planctomyces sp.]
MTKLRAFRCTLAVLAGFGLVAPQSALRAGEKPARPVVADVALDESGALAGAVVSSAGAPVDGAVVTLNQQGKAIARTTTDLDGGFALADVKSGIYELKAGPSQKMVRVWHADAAPPAAREHAVLVVDNTVRGQDEYYELGGLDWISIASLGVGAAGLAVAIVNQSDLNDIQDKLDKLEPASP